MLVEDPASETRVGVELFADPAVGEQPGEDEEEYASAHGRHRAQQGGRWARVTEIGQDALSASARLVGRQVGMVVRETMAGMDRAELAEATTAGLRASSVQLSFGVKLTGGAGKAIEAFVTAGGEASVQVVVTLDRAG